VASFVDDLDKLRRHWGYQRWIVGGHSWGASLALAYAGRYPDRVDGVLYISGTGLGSNWHTEYEDAVARRLGEGQSQLTALKVRRSAFAVDSDEFAATDRAICRIQWSTDFSDAARAPELVETLIDERFVPNYDVNKKVTDDWKRVSDSWEFREALIRVECPVLIVHGSDDPRPVSAVEDLADILADCRVHTIDRAGHFPWLERTDEFRAAVRPWLKAAQIN
jgi:proline iminopeptidase